MLFSSIPFLYYFLPETPQESFPLINEIYQSFSEGNIEKAREAQKKADKIIRVILKYSVIPVVKMVLEERGYEVGNASFPMTRFTEEEKAIYLENESYLYQGKKFFGCPYSDIPGWAFSIRFSSRQVSAISRSSELRWDSRMHCSKIQEMGSRLASSVCSRAL